MTIEVIHCAQRSEEWYAARLGRVTGSRAADVVAKIKTGEAAARRDYRTELVIERLTGKPADSDGFISKEMQRGIDMEPVGIAIYEALTGNIVRGAGFVSRTDIMAGCSPDGLVGADGGIEVKAPKSATHIRYLRAGTLPPEYFPQVVHNLWVTGRQWWDFISVDDRMPAGLQHVLVRMRRDEQSIAEYEAAVRSFLDSVAAEEAELRARMRGRAEAKAA